MKHLFNWFTTFKQETSTFKKGLLRKIIILLSFLTYTTPSAAQPPSCSYTVHNPGGCTIVVQGTYYDNTNSLCLPIQTQTIAAYSDATYNCGSCTPTLSNVVVDLNSIGGGAIGASVDINNQNTQGSNSSGCGSSNYTMSWNYNETFIGY